MTSEKTGVTISNLPALREMSSRNEDNITQITGEPRFVNGDITPLETTRQLDVNGESNKREMVTQIPGISITNIVDDFGKTYIGVDWKNSNIDSLFAMGMVDGKPYWSENLVNAIPDGKYICEMGEKNLRTMIIDVRRKDRLDQVLMVTTTVDSITDANHARFVNTINLGDVVEI